MPSFKAFVLGFLINTLKPVEMEFVARYPSGTLVVDELVRC